MKDALLSEKDFASETNTALRVIISRSETKIV